MATEVTIHGTGSGTCSLTGKTGDGLTVTFKDGTVTEAFLSWKGFQQILALKAGKNGKAITKTASMGETNGVAVGRSTSESIGRSDSGSVGIATGRTEGISTGHNESMSRGSSTSPPPKT